MTRKLLNINLDNNTKVSKRILKPAVEKRRRDRINQSLGELRGLLLKNTCDVRLQNPKIEKAEILDVTVEYLQKWTEKQSDCGCDSSVQMKVQHVPLNLPDSMASPVVFSVQNAGFQRCVAQLASYSSKLSPPHRTRLIQELKTYVESQCSTSPRTTSDLCGDARTNKEEPETTGVPSGFTLLPHHHPSPYHHHDYISPPASPLDRWADGCHCSTPAYATPPPFPSLPCHFSFPPSLSPPHMMSPNASSCCSSSGASSHSLDIRAISSTPVGFSSPVHSPLCSLTPAFLFPPRTTTRRPLVSFSSSSSSSSSPSPREEGVPANSPPRMWQPWS